MWTAILDKARAFWSETEVDIPTLDDDTLPTPTDVQLARLLETYRLSTLLPWEAYDPTTMLFYTPTAVQAIIEVIPITGADEAQVKVLSGLIRGLPEGATLQWTQWASPNVWSQLSQFGGSRQSDPAESRQRFAGREARHTNIYRQLARKQIGHFAAGTYQSIHPSQILLIKDVRLFLTISVPRMADEESQAKELCLTRDSIVTTLAAGKLGAFPLDADAFCAAMEDILNPQVTPERHPVRWDEGRLLGYQLVHPDTRALVGRDGLMLNDVEVRPYSVVSYPSTWALAAMAHLTGDIFEHQLRIPCPYLFTMGIELPDQTSMRSMATVKVARAEQTTHSWLSRIVPRYRDRYYDWQVVQRHLEEGEGIVRIYHQLVLYAPRGTGKTAQRAALALFENKGWKLRPSMRAPLQGWLSALPATFTPQLAAELGRFHKLRRLTTRQAAKLSPVLAEWRGTSTPKMLLIGRRGQLQYFSNRETTSGKNVVVVASTGSGKSVLAQYYVLCERGTGGLVWVIDKGDSYKRLCRLLRGNYTSFDGNVSLNPFPQIQDFDNEILLLIPLFSRMAFPKEETSSVQDQYLAEAIRHAWQRYGPETTPDPIVEHLRQQHDSRAKDLGICLTKFCAEGHYRNFMRGPSTIDFSNPFVCFEMSGLVNRKDLLPAAMFSLIYRIRQAMYFGAREQTKNVIIDEAHELLAIEGGRQFMQELARQGRKHNMALVTITQSISDYFANDTTRTCWEQSAYKLFLQLDAAALAYVAESKCLSLSPFEHRCLKSLRKNEGYSSDVLLQGPFGTALSSFVPDPFMLTLFTTTPVEATQLEQLEQQGRSLEQAIEIIAHGRKAGTTLTQSGYPASPSLPFQLVSAGGAA